MTDVWDELVEEQEALEEPEAAAESVAGSAAEEQPAEAEEPAKDPKASAQAAMDLDERRKRQQLEDQLRRQNEEIAELRGMVKAGSQGAAEEPDLVDYSRDDLGLPALLEARDKRAAEERQKIRQERFQNRLAVSEESARMEFDDFDEKADVFVEAAKNNPGLFQMWRNHADPARFAYLWGRKNGSPTELAALKKENEELRAKLEKGGEPPPKKRTSNASGSGRGAKPGGAGEPADEDVLDDALDGR